jgi:hypothetical protein
MSYTKFTNQYDGILSETIYHVTGGALIKHEHTLGGMNSTQRGKAEFALR